MRRLDDRELRVSYGSNTVAKLSELVRQLPARGAPISVSKDHSDYLSVDINVDGQHRSRRDRVRCMILGSRAPGGES